MTNSIIQKIKPFLFNFATSEIWENKLSEIMKTRAFKKCLPSSRLYLKSQPMETQFQHAFKRARSPEVGMDLMKRLCPDMIPDSDLLEFFGRAIPSASVYMKTIFEWLDLEFEAPMNTSNQKILERTDFVDNDETDELYKNLKDNGLQSLGDDLHLLSAPVHLLVAAQTMHAKSDIDVYAKLVAEFGFNDLCRSYLSMCTAKNSSTKPFYRNFMFYKLSDIFQMMYVTECVAYALLSKKHGTFIDFRPNSEMFMRYRWDYFWKIVLLDKWFPFTYPLDEAEFQMKLKSGEYEAD